MLGPAARSLLGIAFVLAVVPHCRRQARERERAAAAERAAREAPRYVPPVIPVDPPLEKVRVPNSGLPCEVDDVLARKCRRCHTTPARHNAPFELYTWEDTRMDRGGQPLYLHVGRVVDTGYMPLALELKPPVERLTPEEKKILLDWVAAGAPKATCPPAASAPKPTRTSSSRRAGPAPSPAKR